MKVSYIITPMTDTTHLARCINSIYRQIGTDYYVILAENFAGNKPKELTEYLNSLHSLIRISDKANSFEQKLNEAVSLIPSDSSHVMFINVTSVISPVAAHAILQKKDSELIFPIAAKRKEDDFEVDKFDASQIINKLNEYTPWRFCFKKSLLSETSAEYLKNQYKFSLFILSQLINPNSIAVTKDICIYLEDQPQKGKPAYTVDDISSDVISIVENLNKIKDPHIKMAVFDNITFSIMEFEESGNKIVREDVHVLLQTVCRTIQNDAFLKKLFESRVGCEADIFMQLGCEEYDILRERALIQQNRK